MLVHYGLTAGLRFGEMGPMEPGMICDLYIMRMRYDDDQHGVIRKTNRIYD